MTIRKLKETTTQGANLIHLYSEADIEDEHQVLLSSMILNMESVINAKTISDEEKAAGKPGLTRNEQVLWWRLAMKAAFNYGRSVDRK